jgi:hypothetical protein
VNEGRKVVYWDCELVTSETHTTKDWIREHHPEWREDA